VDAANRDGAAASGSMDRVHRVDHIWSDPHAAPSRPDFASLQDLGVCELVGDLLGACLGHSETILDRARRHGG